MADEQKDTTNDSEMVEIRQEYKYAQNEKRHIREEGDEDMKYLAGDPWDPNDRQAREDLNRPVITADELNQYVNQLINDVRQNKRGIRVAPAGAGATDKTAELRQSLIRQIEYRSNASLDAYPIMFENAAQRGYGYLRIKPDYVDVKSFDQELRILPVANPNMITEDPNHLRPDGSDWKFLYFCESWAAGDFKRRWSGATIQSFGGDAMSIAPDWVKGDRIMVAERWRIVTKKRKLLLVQMPAGPVDPRTGQAPPAPAPVAMFEDELKKQLGALPPGAKVIRDREVDYPTVKQQIVNGLEILEEHDFPGTAIPFVACYGKVLYMDDGSGPKKQLMSLIRLAREPFMLYCYYRTQQAEIASMIPKTPIGGYKGQFSGLETDYQKLPHEPLAFAEYNFTAEGWNPSWGPMPPPQRLGTSVGEHLQSLELCAEGARRAIQAAIGSSPLPTQAQRRNEKSGVALKQIEDTAQKGSFHFIDHFDGALTRTGQILVDLIPHYYDAMRDVTVRQPDDQPTVIRINDPNDPKAVNATDGQHDVTISVGPRESSEREAASNFADALLGSPLMQLMPPPLALKIAALAVRLKAVGPIGDEIADSLAPPEGENEGPTPQQVAQMQAQIQELTAQLQQAHMALETDQAKEQAKVAIEKFKADAQVELQRMKNATAIAVANIGAQTQGVVAGNKAQVEELALQVEVQENEKDRQHEVALKVVGAHQDDEAQRRAHGRNLEAGDVEHRRSLEAGEIDAQRAAEQSERDAARGEA